MLATTPSHAAVVPAQIVLSENDSPTGGPLVTNVEHPFVNDAGQVAFVGDFDDGTHFVFIDGIVFVSSDDATFTLDAVEDFMDSNGLGSFIYQPDIDGADGLYSELGVLVFAGAPAIGLPAPATFTFHGGSDMRADGGIYFVSGYDADEDGTTDGRVLYFSPDGAPGGIMPLLQTGDVLNDGVNDFTIDTAGVDLDFAYSDSGVQSIHVLNMEGATVEDGFISVNGSIVGTPREGDPTGDGENWDNFDLVAINNSGNYLFSGDTDGALATDEFVAYNGNIALREGTTVDSVELTSPASLRFLALNNLDQAVHTWGHGTGPDARESVFFACNAADLGGSQALLTTVDDEIDVDGDGTGDFIIVDIEGTGAEETKSLGDTSMVYVEVDVDDGSGPLNAVVAIPVTCCGNGMVDGGEECDDANDDDTDACLSTCIAASCGDGFVQVGVEECDDANDDDTDECPSTCLPAACGDGFVQDGVEECDDGNDVDSDECPSTCVPASCGDGFVQEGVEECDDGNDVDDDECANACTINATGSTGADSDGSGDTGLDDTAGSTDGDETTGGVTDPDSTDGGSSSSGDGTGSSSGGADDSGGCSCQSGGHERPLSTALGLLLAFGMVRRRRHR